MDDGRHFPHSGRFGEEDADPSDSGRASEDADGASPQKPLTHRPRRQARLKHGGLQAIPGGLQSSPFPPQTGRAQEFDPTDLHPFAKQLIAIAEQLKAGAFASSDTSPPASIGDAAPDAPLEAQLASVDLDQRRKAFAEMARSAYARRRKRGAIFGDAELFGEPAWDILLDLYVAQAEDKTVSVSSACIGSAAPPTTGLRWLGILSEQGLVEREHDAQDQRRVLVRLTDRALEAMDEYFSSGVVLHGDRRKAQA